MDKNFSRVVRLNQSGLGCLASLTIFALFLGAIGLGWIVNGALIIIGLLLLLPVVAWLGLRWWISRSLVESSCPVCSYEFTGFSGAECRCPNCGEPLQVEKGEFKRLSAVGTIDVKAVDVLDD
jgi:hypothetical protein